MPMKTCPKCAEQCGPRTLYCKKCGNPYTKTLIKFGHIQKGAAVSVAAPQQNVVVNNNIVVTNRNPYKASVPVFSTPNSEINLDPRGYFDKMIDREAQTNIMISAARTAIETNFNIRNHILLSGLPANGKSSLIKCFIDMVGEENTYSVDATTSTQAGILSDLVERGPGGVKFLILNELEKVKNGGDEYRWLLGAMDERKELRVCNSKIGNIQMPFPVLVIADCNDIEKLKGFMSGALYSRFTNRVFCPRLSDESIFKAIQRYVKMINGKDEWIKPVIDYVRKEKGTDDIREMIAIVTDGRERITSGEYFNILRACS